MMLRRAALLASLVLAAGCGDDADGDDSLQSPPEGEGVQLQHSYQLEPGGEVYYCQYYILPEAGLAVGRYEHTLTAGGHHITLYDTNLTPEDVDPAELEVFDCNTIVNHSALRHAYVGAGTTGEEVYPAGVGRRFEGQVVMLESHMLNAGEHTLAVDYRVNLWFTDEVEQEVGSLFFYDPHILIEGNSRFGARMSCGVPADIQVAGLAMHMHTRGARFEVRLRGASGGTMPIAQTTNWDVTEPTRFDPPLAVSAGDKIEFDCDYQNDDPHPVTEGPSKNDNEMCLLLGSYWPRIDDPAFDVCAHKGSGPLLDGTATCGESLTCLAGTTDPVAAEACAIDTCAGSSEAFNDLYSCIWLDCYNPGLCPDGDCSACMFEACSPEIGVCQETGC